jgi:hypothetical protein
LTVKATIDTFFWIHFLAGINLAYLLESREMPYRKRQITRTRTLTDARRQSGTVIAAVGGTWGRPSCCTNDYAGANSPKAVGRVQLEAVRVRCGIRYNTTTLELDRTRLA